jgi:hypothetical protein
MNVQLPADVDERHFQHRLEEIVGATDSSGTPDMGGPSPDTATSTCVTTGTSVTIGTNHGHVLTVSKEDVATGLEKTYSIQGGSAHDHEVTLTVSDFTQLQAGNQVVKQSTTGDLHVHSVIVTCA